MFQEPKTLSNYLINIILMRVYKQNKNFLLVICGETGSGKSYAALRLAEVLDKKFSARQVVFNKLEFFELLKSNILRKGSVIVFDEAGVSLSARKWFEHHEINNILQTFRHRNYIVIFTVPSFEFVDKQARELFHAYFQIMGIDYDNNQSIAKVLLMQNNPRFGKVYYRTPTINFEGHSIKQRTLRIQLPSKQLLNDYEKRKGKFTGKIVADANERKKKKEYYFQTIEHINNLIETKKIKNNQKEIENVWRKRTGTVLMTYYRMLKQYQKTKRQN